MHRKAPIEFLNRTNYFNPSTSATRIKVVSPSSYQFRKNKVEGYETRLYYEYLYCLSQGGQTIYLTFTYNDKSIPTYNGRNVFDYEHLTYLLNGALKQHLKRNYGTKYKYFVGAELGEGAGVRGYANNPHYHILFFLRPDDGKDSVPFVPIQPFEFRRLCRIYWQGFDQDIDRRNGDFHSFKDAKFGIVKEGKFGISVNSYRACVYCAKYVTKDAGLQRLERSLITDAPYYDFRFFESFSLGQRPSLAPLYHFDTLRQWHLWSLEKASDDLRIFRNRYSNKCRISNGVGLYALEYIKDVLNPTIPVPDSKKGNKDRPISLYYYRKLFTDVYKAENGSPVYVLNDLGLRYKLTHLNESLTALQERTLSRLCYLTPQLYDKINKPEFGAGHLPSYNDFVDHLNLLPLQEVVKRYAEFKLIYQYHFWEIAVTKTERYFPFMERVFYRRISPVADYVSFQTSAFGKVRFDSDACARFLRNTPERFYSYDQHIYFSPYLCVFDVFDAISLYMDIQKDDEQEVQAEVNRQVYNFHKHKQLTQFFQSYDS